MGNMIRSEAISEAQKTPEPFEEIDDNFNFPKVNFPLLQSCVVWRCDSHTATLFQQLTFITFWTWRHARW